LPASFDRVAAKLGEDWWLLLGQSRQVGLGASYVIAILGRQYGQRRWTRFESDAFKDRFGDYRVIPIWASDAMPTAFDRTAGIGGEIFDPNDDLDSQALRIANICSRKLEAV
jgi:hypothetical protein